MISPIERAGDAADSLPMRRSDPTRGRRPRGRTVGSGLAWLLLVLGIAASGAAGTVWRSEQLSQTERSFNAEAASVGSTVTSAIRRMDDLTVAARTVVGSNPTFTNAQLAEWYRAIGAQRRYPGTLGFGFVQLVPQTRLADYLAALHADPVPGLATPAKTLRLGPPGRDGNYCLIRLGVSTSLARLVPGGATYDLCSVPGVGSILAPPSSGRITALSAAMPPWGQILVVSAPVFRGGEMPSSAAARRARMLGWMTGVFDVASVLGGAVAGDSRLSIAVARDDASSLTAANPPPSSNGGRLTPVASVERPGGGTHFTRRFGLTADGHWVVTVSRTAGWGRLSPTRQGIAVFLAGCLVSMLVFVLLQVLARGRSRALRMVAEKTDELRHQALHDSLTGLPNRALLMDRAQQLLARSRRERTQAAAMFIDLDEFKSVNDTFGHPSGDELLRTVAARFSTALREPDTIGRLGGDEFLVLIESDPRTPGAELVAQRLLDVLDEPFRLEAAGGEPLTVTASIGIAVGDRELAQDLLRDADIALYEAKVAGRNRYTVFHEEMQATLQRQRELELDLHHALERDELFLEYQPTFDLADERLTGVEALVRWRHPRRGIVPPGDFIPLAESSGLIVQLGNWVLETACRQGAAWHATGFPIDISVNISPVQFEDPGFLASVADALSASGLDPRFLILEITETALMHDPESVARGLADLKEIGVRIAVDDFGTGYSSLAYLQQFPVDDIKIDRTFIARIATSSESRALIRTVVELGRTLKLRTVAEGIEQRSQLAQLRSEECELGQGFLFARPLDAAATESLLRQSLGRAQRPAGSRPSGNTRLALDTPGS